MKKLRGYLKETHRPVYSAALILPFLCIYHAGILLLNTDHINGADALIIRILGSLSIHSIFASVLVLATTFTVWQLRTRASWKINGRMLLIYLLESICFALLLVFAFSWLDTHIRLSATGASSSLSGFVLFCGAGVYEELLFRGFLLGLLLLAFRRIFPDNKTAASATAAILAALLFSAFHYIGSAADVFTWGSFAQRTFGGLYFSVLFITRGFGLTAASHAIYDIIIGLLF
jgi:membrane protease YdiL (CAAX protease family)